MRDAISVLERCVSESKEILKYEDVLRIIGAIDDNIINNMVENILQLNATAAISIVDDIVNRGKDLRQFNYQVTEKFLDRLVESKEDTSRYIYIIDRLSKLDNDLRLTSRPVIVLKSAIVELCSIKSNMQSENKGNDLNNMTPLLNKISYLEAEIEKLKKSSIVKSVPKVSNDQIKIAKEEDTKEATPFADIENFKKDVVSKGKLKLYSSLASAKAYENSNSLIFITNNSFAYSILIMQENIDDLENIYEEKYGVHKNVIIRLKEEKKDDSTKIEKILMKNDVNYTSLD